MIYLFKNPETGEVKEVAQSMNDEHTHSENGVKFERVLTVPNAAVDTKWNPWDSKDFANKSGNKKGTYGDLLDKSAELSEQRADKNGGVDPRKEEYYKKYSQTRKGEVHPDVKKKECIANLDKMGVSVELPPK